MKKYVVCLLWCAWILWRENVVTIVQGQQTSSFGWSHIDAFDSRETCEQRASALIKSTIANRGETEDVEAEKSSPFSYVRRSKDKDAKGRPLMFERHRFQCYPSDFDPRPRFKDA